MQVNNPRIFTGLIQSIATAALLLAAGCVSSRSPVAAIEPSYSYMHDESAVAEMAMIPPMLGPGVPAVGLSLAEVISE